MQDELLNSVSFWWPCCKLKIRKEERKKKKRLERRTESFPSVDQNFVAFCLNVHADQNGTLSHIVVFPEEMFCQVCCLQIRIGQLFSVGVNQRRWLVDSGSFLASWCWCLERQVVL